jgi:hypothetical protein
MQDHLSHSALLLLFVTFVLCVFDLMSQYRKGAHVRNQPQFDFLSPLYSNSPV